MQRPLSGLRVLDLSRVLAGPYATMVLGDLGAEIIKIEVPGTGDDSRSFGPFLGNESAYFISINRNKKSVALNLKVPMAKQILKKLVGISDILVENFRPGTMERLELGWDVLKEVNPRLIYAAASGFGRTGPYAHKPAYDIIVQGMGGIMSINGQPDGPPTRVGVSLGDIAAGLYTVVGVLAALEERHRSGMGQLVDVAMLDCQLAVLENALARYFVTGEVPGRLGNRHSTITPFTSVSTSDGDIIVGAGNDGLFVKLAAALGMPELASDERFVTNRDRTRNWEALRPILEERFATKTRAEWLTLLESQGIPCGPINSIEDVVKDAQVIAREMLVDVDHPVVGKHTLAATPIKFSRTPAGIDMPAPTLGQHTQEVLEELLCLPKEYLDECRRAGCFDI